MYTHGACKWITSRPSYILYPYPCIQVPIQLHSATGSYLVLLHIVSTSLQNGGVSSPPKIENRVSDGLHSLCPCVPLPLSPHLSTDGQAIAIITQYTRMFNIDWRQKNHALCWTSHHVCGQLYVCTWRTQQILARLTIPQHDKWHLSCCGMIAWYMFQQPCAWLEAVLWWHFDLYTKV